MNIELLNARDREHERGLCFTMVAFFNPKENCIASREN
jgi:hypothetical protein